MATRKGTPVPDEEQTEEENRDERQRLANMEAELAALKKENEKLKASSVAAPGAGGSKSDKERVAEACKKAAEDGVSAWDVKISIRAPRKSAKDDNSYWLSVNGKTLQVPANDRYFELALPFAQCLTDMISAEWSANDYADSIEDFDPVTNPHRED